jgi:SAM-dependent methyltransferase
VKPTGERVFTQQGRFNPTWQRHVAAYRLCAPYLPDGRVLDLGCGIGHSFGELAPRETVGVDLDAAALEGQDRETVVADMRDLPFPPASFRSLISVHSLEHVPNPDDVLSEVTRVLEPDGTAVLVTPNRLTFGVPDEVIDPYHYVEFSAEELHRLCVPWFDEVTVVGLFGSERYTALVGGELDQLRALLRKDPLRLRRLVPRAVRKRIYDRRLWQERQQPDPRAEEIEVTDFEIRDSGLDAALDVIAVCRGPSRRR